VPILACAAARPSVPPGVAEREILDLEHAWAAAEIRRDIAALGAMMDDRFVFMYGAEAPIDKATVLENVRKNNPHSASTLSELHVTVDGDVAVVTGVDTSDEIVDGKAVHSTFRFTSTFAKRDGRWRALFAHMVPLPPRDEVRLPTEADVIH
jgi:ketosteroid isomerase-like protein